MGADDGGEQHCVAVAHGYGAVGLLGEVAGFKRERAAGDLGADGGLGSVGHAILSCEASLRWRAATRTFQLHEAFGTGGYGGGVFLLRTLQFRTTCVLSTLMQQQGPRGQHPPGP